MLNSKRFRVSALVTAVAVSMCIAAAPASAQTQNGLVNLAVTDVTIQVPVSVAANVCDVNVAVLATQERLGGAQCDATAESTATRGPGNGNGSSGPGGTQDGLINVFLDNVVAQVPISVAANICDLNVGVLAQQLRLGDTDCLTGTVSRAEIPGA